MDLYPFRQLKNTRRKSQNNFNSCKALKGDDMTLHRRLWAGGWHNERQPTWMYERMFLLIQPIKKVLL